MSSTLCLIGSGANLSSSAGSPAAAQIAALRALGAAQGVTLSAVSRFYRSPAFPAGAGPDFVNACAAIETRLPPEDVLALLHRIEAEAGRERKARWSARVLDLDLLAMGDLVLPDETAQAQWRALPPEAQRTQAPDRLILPHPRVQDRAFVLAPLAEIAPLWRHPATGQTVREMLAALPEAERAACQPLFLDNRD
ncbi:MAG: 2-amino-4-hydroxy-6-hydroxymethyldihydropteridine diphosphokinase [Paracoccus sp. (in: a-proteobacteria)]|nr:2-amino-4-hydroxy-6-hydroxymethyldihydropteridine diphosphokinase [Paracoccus sp. (in: a-proteobacteria)]